MNKAVVECEAKKEQRLGNGGILQIHVCEILVWPKQSHIALRIFAFSSLGGAGSGKFGQPSPIDDLGSARIYLQELDEVQKQQPQEPQQPHAIQPFTEESDADTKADESVDDKSDERIQTDSQMGYATQVPAPQSKSSNNRRPNVIEPEYVSVINQDEAHSAGMDELSDVRSQAESGEDNSKEDAKINDIVPSPDSALKHTAGEYLSDYNSVRKSMTTNEQLLSLFLNGVKAPPQTASASKKSTTPQIKSPSASVRKSDPNLADGVLPSKDTSLSLSEKHDSKVDETASGMDQASHAHHPEQQSHSGSKTTTPEKEALEIQKDTIQLLNATVPLQQAVTQSSKPDTIYTPEKIQAILRLDEATAASRTFDEERHSSQYSRKVRAHIRLVAVHNINL